MNQIERNTLNNIKDEVQRLIDVHRSIWRIEKCESDDIEEYGENEYIAGKVDAFEEILRLINAQS